MSAIYTQPRLNFDLERLLKLPPYGGEGLGYNTEGDVLVNVTADGVDVNALWQEVQQVLSAWNGERNAVASLLSHYTINAADAVPQSIADESFEVASEFGEPESLRAPSNAILLGNTLVDYDKAGRFTWKFLRDSTAEQIRAVTNYALAADNKLVNGLIVNRLFNPTPQTNEFGHTCYPLWSNDGMVPPPYLGKTFDATHNHYLISGAEVIDSGDLEALISTVTEHGYGMDSGSRLIAFMNPEEADEVSAFKAGETNNNTVIAKHSFIPSSGAPAYLTEETIVGEIAPAQYSGLKIDGSYGPLWLVGSQYVPSKYLAVVATSGANSPNNPVSVRQHTNAAYQGLRTIPGPVPAYPLQQSFWARCIGVGTRHRGAAAVMQIKETGSYVAPVIPM
ncbi:hypothetical protein LTQ56_04710 [Mycobacterium intracellulare subsp. intracellulare]|uniref:hypothetical protein n=1 Tax=Mycobacterium intracellulare TaxID=1767 RepID=UPI0001B45D0C|nr:hypothetical protein [Mycobacterium intracellulare]UGU07988.1 hypothetical protein LTQ56_04710 [Mycobacterium intracellulare subsp. intracellulare]BCO56981.1 hypothetical protein MINTM005_22250 [Mycobacterium intracellulare]BCO94085.1 hypothetical protein MINTM016_20610 [Mycobacterium intracellulare]